MTDKTECPLWHNTLNGDKQNRIYGMSELSILARNLEYLYFLWNGRVYKILSYGYESTDYVLNNGKFMTP